MSAKHSAETSDPATRARVERFLRYAGTVAHEECYQLEADPEFPGAYLVRDVPIFVEHTRGDVTFTRENLEAIVRHHEGLEKTRHRVPIFAGHHAYDDEEDRPKVGNLRNLRMGEVEIVHPDTHEVCKLPAIFADLGRIKPRYAARMLEGDLEYRSVEVYPGTPRISGLALTSTIPPYFKFANLVCVLAEGAAAPTRAGADGEEFSAFTALAAKADDRLVLCYAERMKVRAPAKENARLEKAREKGSRRSRVRRYSSAEWEVNTWFERDRAHVEVRDRDTGETVVEWWDEEVQELVEDGFLDPRDWRGSAIEYARHLGFSRERGRSRRYDEKNEKNRVNAERMRVKGKVETRTRPNERGRAQYAGERVLLDILAISSGTMASLVDENNGALLDVLQNEFLFRAQDLLDEGKLAPDAKWQEAWAMVRDAVLAKRDAVRSQYQPRFRERGHVRGSRYISRRGIDERGRSRSYSAAGELIRVLREEGHRVEAPVTGSVWVDGLEIPPSDWDRIENLWDGGNHESLLSDFLETEEWRRGNFRDFMRSRRYVSRRGIDFPGAFQPGASSARARADVMTALRRAGGRADVEDLAEAVAGVSGVGIEAAAAAINDMLFEGDLVRAGGNNVTWAREPLIAAQERRRTGMARKYAEARVLSRDDVAMVLEYLGFADAIKKADEVVGDAESASVSQVAEALGLQLAAVADAAEYGLNSGHEEMAMMREGKRERGRRRYEGRQEAARAAGRRFVDDELAKRPGSFDQALFDIENVVYDPAEGANRLDASGIENPDSSEVAAFQLGVREVVREIRSHAPPLRTMLREGYRQRRYESRRPAPGDWQVRSEDGALLREGLGREEAILRAGAMGDWRVDEAAQVVYVSIRPFAELPRRTTVSAGPTRRYQAEEEPAAEEPKADLEKSLLERIEILKTTLAELEKLAGKVEEEAEEEEPEAEEPKAEEKKSEPPGAEPESPMAASEPAENRRSFAEEALRKELDEVKGRLAADQERRMLGEVAERLRRGGYAFVEADLPEIFAGSLGDEKAREKRFKAYVRTLSKAPPGWDGVEEDGEEDGVLAAYAHNPPARERAAQVLAAYRQDGWLQKQVPLETILRRKVPGGRWPSPNGNGKHGK